MISLYENIKKYRQERNMSQQELADKVGYTGKSMISKVERGEVDLSTTMIKKFADALMVTPSDLMGWDGEEHYYLDDEAREMAEFMFHNPEYRVLFDASRKISKEDIETVKSILDKFKRPED